VSSKIDGEDLIFMVPSTVINTIMQQRRMLIPIRSVTKVVEKLVEKLIMEIE